MEFKGTKGKWRACCIETSPHYIFAHEDNVTICRPYMEQESSDDLSLQEYRANALLISKAPELLSMLISIVNYGGIANMDYIKKLIEESTEV